MSIKSHITRGIVAVGVVGAMVSSAHADRRTGMAGSLLIEDNDDVYFFPQTATKYRNQLSLDYGATADAGNALFLLGDADLAYGIALHHGDVRGPTLTNSLVPDPGGRSLGIQDRDRLGSLGTPFGAPFTLQSATFADLLLSLGDVGFRASLGRAVNATSDAAGNDSGEYDTFILGEVGWGTGTRGVDNRIDLSGALFADFGKQVAGGTDVASGTTIGLSGLLRGYSPVDSTMDLGYLASLGIASNSVSQSAVPMPSASTLNFYVGGGVGPAFTFGAAQVAAYGTMRIGYQSDDPDSVTNNDETSTLRFLIPGVQLATEIPITDWLQVRTGAEYSWQLENSSTGAGDAGAGVQDGRFGWNAGLGVIVNQFRFDGALSQGFVTGGPDFIGGTGAGFLAVASITYNFDAARAASTSVVAEPEPTPVQEAAPVPAPAPEAAPAPPPVEPAPVAPAPAAGAAATTTGTTTSTSASGSLSVGADTH